MCMLLLAPLTPPSDHRGTRPRPCMSLRALPNGLAGMPADDPCAHLHCMRGWLPQLVALSQSAAHVAGTLLPPPAPLPREENKARLPACCAASAFHRQPGGQRCRQSGEHRGQRGPGRHRRPLRMTLQAPAGDLLLPTNLLLVYSKDSFFSCSDDFFHAEPHFLFALQHDSMMDPVQLPGLLSSENA